jgi:hypothetical protein
MGWIRAKMRRWRTGCLDTFGGYCDAAQGASGLGKGNGAVRDVGRSAFIHSAGPTSRLWPMRACQKSNAWRSPHTQHARVTRATRTMNSHSYTRPSRNRCPRYDEITHAGAVGSRDSWRSRVGLLHRRNHPWANRHPCLETCRRNFPKVIRVVIYL